MILKSINFKDEKVLAVNELHVLQMKSRLLNITGIYLCLFIESIIFNYSCSVFNGHRVPDIMDDAVLSDTENLLRITYRATLDIHHAIDLLPFLATVNNNSINGMMNSKITAYHGQE